MFNFSWCAEENFRFTSLLYSFAVELKAVNEKCRAVKLIILYIKQFSGIFKELQFHGLWSLKYECFKVFLIRIVDKIKKKFRTHKVKNKGV